MNKLVKKTGGGQVTQHTQPRALAMGPEKRKLKYFNKNKNKNKKNKKNKNKKNKKNTNKIIKIW